MIISGWPLLEEYYDLPYEVVVEVGYYNNNNFGINGFKEVSKWYTTLPHFHSRNVFDDDIHAFDLILSHIYVSVQKLKLQVHTATILRKYGYERLTLCEDSDMPKTMKLFNVDDLYNTELGPGWDDFYECNKFDAGE
ncbi:hypothetical protein RYX36_022254 [Vicia faba]